MIRRLVVIGCVLVAGACFGGCSSAPQFPKCYPVTGKVLIDGQPAVRATVAFHPQSPQADGKSVGSSTFTDDNGEFKLTTFEAGDGAQPGEYAVTIVANFKVEGGQDVSVPDLLQGRYADAKTTPLAVVVKEEPNVVPPFELASR